MLIMTQKKFGNISDIILFYTKSDTHYWNTQYVDYDASYLESHWQKKTKMGVVIA